MLNAAMNDASMQALARTSLRAAPELLGVTAGQLKDFEDNGDTYRFSHAMQVRFLGRHGVATGGHSISMGVGQG